MDFGKGRNDTDEAILAGSDLLPIIVPMIPDGVESPFVVGPDGIAAHHLSKELVVRPSPDFLPGRGIGNHEVVTLPGSEPERQESVGSIRCNHHDVMSGGRRGGPDVDARIAGSDEQRRAYCSNCA